MIDAVIVSTARTGLAKSWKGAFNMTYGATLGGHAVQHAVARSGIDPNEIEDCIMGGSLAEGTTGGNVARAIALRAGLPITVGGVSVNRFCSSGLQTIAMAAQRVMVEGCTAIVAGGVESISCVQNETNTHMRRDPWLVEHKPELYWSMLQTAETVAKRYNISKLAQDEYGVRSQNLAANLQLASFFIGDNTLVCGKNSDSKSAKYSRQLIFANIDSQTRFGDSLQTGDDLLVFVSAVFQGDVHILEYTLIAEFIFCNVSLVYQDISDCDFHFGSRCRT